MCCLVRPLLNQESTSWTIRQAQTEHYQVLHMMQLFALQNKSWMCLLIHHAINFQVWNSLDSWKHDYTLL